MLNIYGFFKQLTSKTFFLFLKRENTKKIKFKNKKAKFAAKKITAKKGMLIEILCKLNLSYYLIFEIFNMYLFENVEILLATHRLSLLVFNEQFSNGEIF